MPHRSIELIRAGDTRKGDPNAGVRRRGRADRGSMPVRAIGTKIPALVRRPAPCFETLSGRPVNHPDDLPIRSILDERPSSHAAP
jgi:hypothetical protein